LESPQSPSRIESSRL